MAHHAGITLVELMVVVAIVAVLIALAAPNMRIFFINNRLDTASNELMTAMNLTRSEAMRRGVPVTIRRLSATAQDWSQGWEVFVDLDGNGTRDAGNPLEEVIRVGPPLVQPVTAYASSSISTFVPFRADGSIALTLDDGFNPYDPRASMIICYEGVLREGTQSRSRALLLNSAGRVRPGIDSNKDGRPENAGGSNITNCTNPS